MLVDFIKRVHAYRSYAEQHTKEVGKESVVSLKPYTKHQVSHLVEREYQYTQ